MSKYIELLRAKVRAECVAQKISQNELGRRMDVSSAEISDWLSGNTAMKFERACQMAEALGMRLDLLKSAEISTVTPQLQESGPQLKLIDTKSALIGQIVVLLDGLDEVQLLGMLRSVKAGAKDNVPKTSDLKGESGKF